MPKNLGWGHVTTTTSHFEKFSRVVSDGAGLSLKACLSNLQRIYFNNGVHWSDWPVLCTVCSCTHRHTDRQRSNENNLPFPPFRKKSSSSH